MDETDNETFRRGGTCLVRQPRLFDGVTFEIQETIFLGRVVEVEDGQVDAVTRLGPIPDDDEATTTGDGARVRLFPEYGLEIYADTPTHRRLLRALQRKEDEAAKLESALIAVAGVAPEKIGEPLRSLFTRSGRYR